MSSPHLISLFVFRPISIYRIVNMSFLVVQKEKKKDGILQSQKMYKPQVGMIHRSYLAIFLLIRIDIFACFCGISNV